MNHKHYCEVAGHEWVCQSTDCVSICHIQMERGDHRQCPIELRACSEHPYGLALDASNDHLRMKIPANIDEMILKWASSTEDSIGWCLLCDSPIPSEDDMIPGTNTHDCEAGQALDAGPLPQQGIKELLLNFQKSYRAGRPSNIVRRKIPIVSCTVLKNRLGSKQRRSLFPPGFLTTEKMLHAHKCLKKDKMCHQSICTRRKLERFDVRRNCYWKRLWGRGSGLQTQEGRMARSDSRTWAGEVRSARRIIWRPDSLAR